jgi:hypothetical protein
MREELESVPLVIPRNINWWTTCKDIDSPVSEPTGTVRVCLGDFGLGLASIIPRESGKLCDGNAERLRFDELPVFEARREVEVGSEPALLQRDYDVEKVRQAKAGLKRETHMLTAGPRLCAVFWRRTDEGLCSIDLDCVLRSVRSEQTSVEHIVRWSREVI